MTAPTTIRVSTTVARIMAECSYDMLPVEREHMYALADEVDRLRDYVQELELRLMDKE